MKRIFVPTTTGTDWQRLLGKPRLHWKMGRSAMSAAACWEENHPHLPPEIMAVLASSGDPALADLELLAAMPEWEVALPGGDTSSQTDVLAVARNRRGLVVLAVEAKVDEPSVLRCLKRKPAQVTASSPASPISSESWATRAASMTISGTNSCTRQSLPF